MLFSEEFHFFLLHLDLLLQIVDVPLLVLAVLGVARCPHEELEGNGVIGSVQVTFTVKQVNPVEAIVTPAFPYLKLRCKLTNNLGTWSAMVDHLNSVLVLLGLLLWQSLQHFQEHTYVIALGNAIAVWVYFQSPSKSRLRDERWVGVDYLVVILDLVVLTLPYP